MFERVDHSETLVMLTRLNHEPIVFLGLNRSEIKLLLVSSILFWLPLIEAVFIAMGKWMMGFPVAVGLITATVVISGAMLRRVKRNRPEGYYQMAIRMKMEDLHLMSTYLIRKAGPWDTRHHKPIGGVWIWRSKTR